MEGHQREDKECKELITRLERGEDLDGYKVAGSLYNILVPNQLIKTILRYFYDSSLTGGHTGIYKTSSKIVKIYTWDGLVSDVKKYVTT